MTKAWAEAGHDVTVLTSFPQHPRGIKRKEDHYVLYREEDYHGVRVRRAYIWAHPNSGNRF
uniref:CAZy families GT4 protein n=1 Tax=uncultured Sorangium sp. TaxID=491148 RepID=A0A060CER4_9BACT|nr:CAZy families GT4 protein [uncultured Sorangium sp.]